MMYGARDIPPFCLNYSQYLHLQQVSHVIQLAFLSMPVPASYVAGLGRE
jgi:hypothetical protein